MGQHELFNYLIMCKEMVGVKLNRQCDIEMLETI